VAWDVFQENHGGLTLADDPGDVGPEVTWVVCSSTLAGEAEGLAGIAGGQDIDSSAPLRTIEGRDVIPDREGCKGSVILAGDEDGLGVLVPFDGADGAVVVEGEVESELEAGDTGTQAEAADGRCTHI